MGRNYCPLKKNKIEGNDSFDNDTRYCDKEDCVWWHDMYQDCVVYAIEEAITHISSAIGSTIK